MLDRHCLPHALTSEHAAPKQPPPAHQDEPHHTRPHRQNSCSENALHWMPEYIQVSAVLLWPVFKMGPNMTSAMKAVQAMP